MTNKLKPQCKKNQTGRGVLIKGGVDYEVEQFLAKNDFEHLLFDGGDYRNKLDFLPSISHKVKSLRIETNDFDWGILPHLSELKSLEIGGWFKCDIDFSGLKKLEYLRTYWNDGYGDDFFEIPNLRALRIQGFKHETFEGVGRLNKLEYFYGVDSRKLKSLSGLEQLKKLKFLHLMGYSQLSDISNIGGCENLEILKLEKTKCIKDFCAISQLTKLKELLLIGGESDYLLWLESHPAIEDLRFDLKILDGNLSFIKTLPRLEYIGYTRAKGYSPSLKEIVAYMEERGFVQNETKLKVRLKFPSPEKYI